MPLEIPIRIKGGPAADYVPGAPGEREPHFNTDAKRFYVGDTLVGFPTFEAALNVAAAGNTNVVVTSGAGIHLVEVTIGAGVGAYTNKLLLPATESGAVAVPDGTIYVLKLAFAASVNPTIEIRNEAAGGTLIWSFTPPEGAARTFTVVAVRTGGAWKLWMSNEPTIS